jgi:hypothetical protein
MPRSSSIINIIREQNCCKINSEGWEWWNMPEMFTFVETLDAKIKKMLTLMVERSI